MKFCQPVERCPSRTVNKVSSHETLLSVSHGQNVAQIGPPCSSDPIVGGPTCRSRREAWTAKDIERCCRNNSIALDLNAPNREGLMMSRLLDNTSR